ncbi:MAG: head GIN domain-containing protein [Cyclobacteriaceae bacterium]
MKSKISFLIITIISFGLSAQKRTIEVSGFTELSFGISGTVYLTQGSNEKVEIDCSDEIFEKIEFELKGDRLSIKNRDKWNWRGISRSDVDIYITMKEIEEISLSGSGTIQGENTLNTDDIQLSVSGSGSMELDMNGREVGMRISGSGDIELEGKAERSDARISGSGKVRAKDFEVKIFEASISGSGNCYITASEEISASISGSGNVYYNGNPDRLVSNSSGSGKIRKM